MLKETNIDFTSLYKQLYTRPIAETRFQGFILENFTITDHGVAYIKIDENLLKEYEVDTGTSGSLINNLKYIDGVIIIIFLTEDKKSNLIKANIRSEGPTINELASIYGGGGHKYASGARLTSWEQADNLINDLDNLAEEFQKQNTMANQ
jgi:phosphoesterase RecJ-like protein